MNKAGDLRYIPFDAAAAPLRLSTNYNQNASLESRDWPDFLASVKTGRLNMKRRSLVIRFFDWIFGYEPKTENDDNENRTCKKLSKDL